MSYALIVMGAIAVTGAIVQQVGANSKRNDELDHMKDMNDQMNALLDARQAIPNVGRHYKDLSKDLSNPYANLAVATQAAEMQAEESDIALANTLDTLRASGTSAGGATALAQAALRSKQGISASIESQEVANEKLRAGGEQSLQMAKMQEQQRLQGARAGAEQWMYSAQETRSMAEINRTAGMLDQSRAQSAEYSAQANAAAAQTTQAATQMVGAGMKSGTGGTGGTVDTKTTTVNPTSDPLQQSTTTQGYVPSYMLPPETNQWGPQSGGYWNSVTGQWVST